MQLAGGLSFCPSALADRSSLLFPITATARVLDGHRYRPFPPSISYLVERTSTPRVTRARGAHGTWSNALIHDGQGSASGHPYRLHLSLYPFSSSYNPRALSIVEVRTALRGVLRHSTSCYRGYRPTVLSPYHGTSSVSMAVVSSSRSWLLATSSIRLHQHAYILAFSYSNVL